MLKKDKHIQSCKNSTRSKLKWANSAKLDFGEEPQNNCFCVTVASMFFVGLWPSFCSFSCYTRVVARMQHHQTSIIFLELIKAHEKIHTYSTLFYIHTINYPYYSIVCKQDYLRFRQGNSFVEFMTAHSCYFLQNKYDHHW